MNQELPGDFAVRVRRSFSRQPFMRLIGAELANVEWGVCEISLLCRDELQQQNGYLHGGVLATLVDNASGYAALSVSPPGSNVLAVEFKLNFLAPVRAVRVRARGEVVRAGRTLIVVRAEVRGEEGGIDTVYAVAQETVIRVADGD